MTAPTVHPAWCARDASCTAYTDAEELEQLHRGEPLTIDLDPDFTLIVVLTAAPTGGPDIEVGRHEMPLPGPYWLDQPTTGLILTLNAAAVLARALTRLLRQATTRTDDERSGR